MQCTPAPSEGDCVILYHSKKEYASLPEKEGSAKRRAYLPAGERHFCSGTGVNLDTFVHPRLDALPPIWAIFRLIHGTCAFGTSIA